MNNISLEIIEKDPERVKRVTIREEKNTIRIIPPEGKGNPLIPKQENINNLSSVSNNLSSVSNNLFVKRTVDQRHSAQPRFYPRSAPFMMNFNRNIGMMPMRFK